MKGAACRQSLSYAHVTLLLMALLLITFSLILAYQRSSVDVLK